MAALLGPPSAGSWLGQASPDAARSAVVFSGLLGGWHTPLPGSTVCFFWFRVFCNRQKRNEGVSTSVCEQNTAHALTGATDDKPSGAEGERQDQETSPSQMAVRVGPHVDRVGKVPTNSWNFRWYSLTTGATLLSKAPLNSPVCQLSTDLHQLSGLVSVTSLPKWFSRRPTLCSKLWTKMTSTTAVSEFESSNKVSLAIETHTFADALQNGLLPGGNDTVVVEREHQCL